LVVIYNSRHLLISLHTERCANIGVSTTVDICYYIYTPQVDVMGSIYDSRHLLLFFTALF